MWDADLFERKGRVSPVLMRALCKQRGPRCTLRDYISPELGHELFLTEPLQAARLAELLAAGTRDHATLVVNCRSGLRTGLTSREFLT